MNLWKDIVENDVKGARLYVSDAREKLANIEPAEARNEIESRLSGADIAGSQSALFELLLHGYFTEAAVIRPEIHPEITDTANRPDFLVPIGPDGVLCEARVVWDERSHLEQSDAERVLADVLREMMLGRQVIVEFGELPSDYFIRRFRAWVQRNLPGTQIGESLFFEDTHNGDQISVGLQVVGDDTEAPALLASSGPITELSTQNRIRAAIDEKASRYGDIETPFVIALWPVPTLVFTERALITGLFGTQRVTITTDSRTGESTGNEGRSQDGAFTRVRNGQPMHSQVSAALIFRERWANDERVERRLTVFHNPHAARPIDEGFLQEARHMLWRPGGGGFDSYWGGTDGYIQILGE